MSPVVISGSRVVQRHGVYELASFSPRERMRISENNVYLYVYIIYNKSGQIIATSHDLTPNGGLVREIPLFQGNLGWWNIIIWPDFYIFILYTINIYLYYTDVHYTFSSYILYYVLMPLFRDLFSSHFIKLYIWIMSFGMMEWAKKLGMMYSVSLLKQELRAPEPLLITGCIFMLYNMYPKHSMYDLSIGLHLP